VDGTGTVTGVAATSGGDGGLASSLSFFALCFLEDDAPMRVLYHGGMAGERDRGERRKARRETVDSR
jgi:hypothetical protein